MSNRKRKLVSVVTSLVFAALACSDGSVEVNVPDPDQVNTAVANLATQSASPPEEQIDETELGSARSNPAPAGSEIIADDMAFVVTGNVRPATDIVIAGNQFNEIPEDGKEYVLVEVQITCKLSSDESCSLFSSSFKLLGNAGIQYDADIFIAGVVGLLEFSNEFYGGATVGGYIPFVVGTHESDLLLVYDQMFGSTFYLAIK